MAPKDYGKAFVAEEMAAVRATRRKVERARAAVKAAEAERDQAVAAARRAGHSPSMIQEAAGLSAAGERVAAGRGGYRS